MRTENAKHRSGRKFLEILLKTCKADVNAQVQKKILTDEVPTDEKDKYEYPDEGMYTINPVHTFSSNTVYPFHKSNSMFVTCKKNV